MIHFPQIAGLGHSTMAEHAIRDLDQAKRYLDDPTLGERLRTCRLMLRHAGKSALQILGAPISQISLLLDTFCSAGLE